jgi:hypothetical protein
MPNLLEDARWVGVWTTLIASFTLLAASVPQESDVVHLPSLIPRITQFAGGPLERLI